MAALRRHLGLVAILLCWSFGASAATIFLKARLDGGQAGVVSPGDGSAFLTYDTTTRLLTWTVNYRGLSSPVNAAHIHGAGGRGVTAAVLVPFTVSASPITGSATITALQEADMLAGLWYVNIHTNNNPGGEIRGQIAQIRGTAYHAPMDGIQAGTPGTPNATSGSGDGTITFDPATLQLTWSLSYSNLTSAVSAAHFHGPAQPFEVAAVEVPSATGNPATGTMTLTPDLAAQFVNGFMYFNIHTGNFSGGEIRGQAIEADPPRLGNISTRMQVLTGGNVMIGGFIVGGTSSKTVAITATGPSLAPFGISNFLADPKITLVRSSDQSVINTNDDWQTDGLSADLQTSGFAPGDPKEAGMLATLDPGAYTAIVEGATGGTGVSVVGVFEVNHLDMPLVNISTRGFVQTGGDVMIGGFIIQGAPQTVVVSATGPSLAPFGISNFLANPQLTLVRSSDQSIVATNDDWQSAPNAAQIMASGFAPGNALEPAILTTLDPGAYTAIVQGAGGGTGVAVVGVFTLP
jgi:hypothetical protein